MYLPDAIHKMKNLNLHIVRAIVFLICCCLRRTNSLKDNGQMLKLKESSSVGKIEQSPSSILSNERYDNSVSNASTSKGNLRKVQQCFPQRCQEIEGNQYYFPLLQIQKNRNLQRGSRSSHKDSSTKYYYTIVYVCVSVLIFMSMVCVGLRHYIGIPQDSSPELTERKKVMKDMTEKEKRSVLEYIFSKQQQTEVDDENNEVVLETKHMSISATDILDETGTMNQHKERELSEDHVEERNILGSFKKEENYFEASVDTKSTRSLNAADSQEEDMDLDEVVCSICLDSLGKYMSS